MPNIQIHGFPFIIVPKDRYSFELELPSAAYRVREKIEQVMRDMRLGEDAVTEIIPSVVASCNGLKTPLPYVRVCDTKPEQLKQIVKALEEANIDMDVEELLLTGFTEAKDMKT